MQPDQRPYCGCTQNSGLRRPTEVGRSHDVICEQVNGEFGESRWSANARGSARRSRQNLSIAEGRDRGAARRNRQTRYALAQWSARWRGCAPWHEAPLGGSLTVIAAKRSARAWTSISERAETSPSLS